MPPEESQLYLNNIDDEKLREKLFEELERRI